MRRIAHLPALAGASAATLLLLAVPASAHVTVSPATATKGGYSTFTFKVPNERDAANTTALEVDFPEQYPFAGVSVQPKEGWGYTVEKAPLATPLTNNDGQQIAERISKITWTADGLASQIKPSEFDTFSISVGPLPKDATTIVLKALQTYSNSEIVRWIEEAAPGTEARYPAPKVTLTDPAPEGATTGTTVTAAPASGDVASAVAEAKAAAEAANKAIADINAAKTSSSTSTDGPTKNQVNTAVGLAIGAIVLALIGAGIGGAALSRRPKEDDVPPPATPAGPPPAF